MTLCNVIFSFKEVFIVKKFIAFVVLLCATMISQTALAKHWEFVCTDHNDNKIYIDVDSILNIKDLLDINYRGYYVQAIF